MSDDDAGFQASMEQQDAEASRTWAQMVSMYVGALNAKQLDNQGGVDVYAARFAELARVALSQGPKFALALLVSAAEMVNSVLLDHYGSYSAIFKEQERRYSADPLTSLEGPGPACAYCGEVMRHPMSSMVEGYEPEAGDRIICSSCLKISVFREVDNGLVPSMLTAEEQAESDADPDVQKWIAAATVVKSTREGIE